MTEIPQYFILEWKLHTQQSFYDTEYLYLNVKKHLI
jgi:hypothetical protein